MKKILLILLLFVSFFLISCNEEREEPNKNDDTVNTTDKEHNNNLGGDDNTEIKTPEIKVIEDFTVDSEVNLYLDEEVKLNIEYDKDIDVEFSYTIDNDNITINENTIKGVKPGISIITVKEERSNISKDITINILLKKNKTIDFYNGYYIYKECVHGLRSYYSNALYENKKVLNINDDTILLEITPYDGYSKAYKINDTGDVLLIKDNELFGAIAFEYNSEGDRGYQIIYSLDYLYEEPTKKVAIVNKDLGINNGIYACGYCLYTLMGGSILQSNPAYYGYYAMTISDDITYTLVDMNSLTGVSFDSIFSKIEANASRFSYNHKLVREDIKKWYNAYSSDDLLYAIAVTDDIIYYVDISYYNNKYKINNIFEAKYLQEYDLASQKNLIKVPSLCQTYLFNDIIYSDNDNNDINALLKGKYAFTINKDTSFIENTDLSLIPEELNLRITKRYDMFGSDDILVKSIMISENDIYYVVFRKQGTNVLLSKIWKLDIGESFDPISNPSLKYDLVYGEYYISEVYGISAGFTYGMYDNEFSKIEINTYTPQEIDDKYDINGIIYSLNSPSIPNYKYHFFTNQVIQVFEDETLGRFLIIDNMNNRYLLELKPKMGGEGYYINSLCEIKKVFTVNED